MNALKELEDIEKLNWDNVLALRINCRGESVIYKKDGISDLEHVKKSLSKIDYDDGYGSQSLFGLILMNDGSWYERGEYDGSEWWSHKQMPSVDEVINFSYCD